MVTDLKMTWFAFSEASDNIMVQILPCLQSSYILVNGCRGLHLVGYPGTDSKMIRLSYNQIYICMCLYVCVCVCVRAGVCSRV